MLQSFNKLLDQNRLNAATVSNLSWILLLQFTHPFSVLFNAYRFTSTSLLHLLHLRILVDLHMAPVLLEIKFMLLVVWRTTVMKQMASRRTTSTKTHGGNWLVWISDDMECVSDEIQFHDNARKLNFHMDTNCLVAFSRHCVCWRFVIIMNKDDISFEVQIENEYKAVKFVSKINYRIGLIGLENQSNWILLTSIVIGYDKLKRRRWL